jgi:hypothetical protein
LRKKAIKVREEFRGFEHGLAWMRDEIADLLVTCTPKSEKIPLSKIPLRVKKIRNYTMDMVWAFYGDGISSGSTFILPKIGSGLRDYAENKIKSMVKDFDLIETWSYDSAIDLISKRRNMITLLPLCVAAKHDFNFIDAFPAKVSYFIHEDFLVTEIGKKLTKIMKSKETTHALSSMLGISMK